MKKIEDFMSMMDMNGDFDGITKAEALEILYRWDEDSCGRDGGVKDMITHIKNLYAEEINNLLIAMGSKFRTADGMRISRYNGHSQFLIRDFDSPEECLEFVRSASKGGEIHV